MVDQHEPEEPGDKASSPKRPRMRAGRGRKRLRDIAEPSAQQQDQIMTDASTHQKPGGSIPPERAAEIAAKYKAWARNGHPHDPHCFECHKDADLVPCVTCPRQYHEACKPEISALVEREGVAQWYCSVCVGLGWHITPPVLSPPASPVSETIELAPSREHSRRAAEAAPIQTPPQEPTAISQAPSSSRASASGTRRRQQRATDTSTITAQDSVHRKSRFNTLPVEVDSALTTLYRELEKIPFLQKMVTDLETELAQSRQVVNMQQNELTMTRRMAEKARALDAELQKLKEEAARKQAAVDDKKNLEAKNTVLESEVEALRAQLEVSNKTLQEWKQNLSKMIGGE